MCGDARGTYSHRAVGDVAHREVGIPVDAQQNQIAHGGKEVHDERNAQYKLRCTIASIVCVCVYGC